MLTDNGIQFGDAIEHRSAPTARYRVHMFDRVCLEHGIEHRFTKPNHPWTNGQVERLNRTLKDATIKRYHYSTHRQLKPHLQAFLDAYNFTRRLKTLNGLTPYEAICKAWTSEPKRFSCDPDQLTTGVNMRQTDGHRRGRGIRLLMAKSTDDIADLIARTALRDRQAFRALYDGTSAKLFGVALCILRDRGDAEEALQEIYVKIWQRAERFVPGGYSPISWLVAVARNHCLDVLRARRPSGDDIEAAEIADPSPDPEASAVAGGERGRIEACLQALEADRASAVRGAYLDGYSYEELASRFEVPLNTMRTWLRRSLIKLRECLSQ